MWHSRVVIATSTLREYVTKMVHYIQLFADTHTMHIQPFGQLLQAFREKKQNRSNIKCLLFLPTEYVLTAINKNTLTISGHVFLFSTILWHTCRNGINKSRKYWTLSTIDKQIRVIAAGRKKWMNTLFCCSIQEGADDGVNISFG